MSIPLRLSPVVTDIAESGTVAIFSKVADMKSRGEKVNGALCVGQPDFPPPPEVLEATKEAVDKGVTVYTGVTGTLDLRRSICEYLNNEKQITYTPEEIVISCGGKQAIYQTMLALCQQGDEVIVPSPYWTSYPDIVKLSGASPVVLHTQAEKGYVIDPTALAASTTSKTRMLIVCNPSNPTGCAMTAGQLEAIAEVLRKPENQQIYVLADEIYERICFDGLCHRSFASLPGMRDRTLTINGFSKAFSMTGYRLGYLAAPKPIAQAVAKLQSQITSCAPSISQHAGIAALRTSREYIDNHVVELQRKRDLAHGLLLKIPSVTCPKPQGAFYLFPDVSEYFGCQTIAGDEVKDAIAICLHLLSDYNVALVPGDTFGCSSCIRLSYAATVDDITDAIAKLHDCLSNLQRPKRAKYE